MYLSRTRSQRLRRIFHLWNDFLMFDFGMFSLKLTRGAGGRQMMMMRSDEYEEKSSDNFPIGKFIAKRNFWISSLLDFREKMFTFSGLCFALLFNVTGFSEWIRTQEAEIFMKSNETVEENRNGEWWKWENYNMFKFML